MMIQDITPHKLNNQYDPDVKAGPEDFVLVFSGRTVLIITAEKTLVFPRIKDFSNCLPEDFTYLFSIDDERYFLPGSGQQLPEVQESGFPRENEPDVPFRSAASFTFRDIKDLREKESQPKYRMFAIVTGKHLYDWYRDTAFCGRCGSKMSHSGKERAMVCPSCGYTAYPRIMPAVIVGVLSRGRILLTRYRTGYNHNALIAGFTEIGETVEETVSREVFEEAGIHVKNIRYYKSQPWGVSNDILMGYYCDADGDDRIRMDKNELKYAEWTAPGDVELQPDESSLTNEMMKRFKEGLPC